MSTTTLETIRPIPTSQREKRDCVVCATGPDHRQTPAVVKAGEGSLDRYGSGRGLCVHCAVVPTTGEEQARALAAVLTAYEERPWTDVPQGVWEDVLLRDGVSGEVDWDATGEGSEAVTLRSGAVVSWDEPRDRWEVV